MKRHIRPLAILLPALAFAHPMGNFSVSHYGRIEVERDGARIRYVLDLAEIPTFQLLQQWQLDASSPPEQLERHAAEQARQWAGNLQIELDGRAVKPQFERAAMVMAKGAGGMAILRVTAELRVAGAPGSLHYQDGNFPDRAGWKEIVIVAGPDAAIDRAFPAGTDRSRELTEYPQDPLLAPPQDLTAAVSWHSTASPTETAAAPVMPAAPPAPGPSAGQAAQGEIPPAAGAAQPGQSAPGMVVRGDYLSRLLHQGDIGWGMMVLGMVVAFGLGAIHALSPGHGKTIVAAYLVGARGTAKHAIFLGGMVTFTHTISVFFLGLVTLFLSRYVLPEKIYPVLGAISGASIVWIGAMLLYKRTRVAFGGSGVHYDQGQGHPHTHEHAGLVHDHGDGHVHSDDALLHTHEHAGLVHDHGDGHVHSHDALPHTHEHAGLVHDHGDGHVHSHDALPHTHEHGGLVHDHGDGHVHSHDALLHTHEHAGLVHDHGDGHVHSHVPEGDITMGSLIALGASGGLVPCPSALVLLLSSVALGRVGLGLTLLLAFSTGLAVVLSGIGLVVLYAKNLLPDSQNTARNAVFRYVPVASAAVIVCAGILMTGVALGVIRPFPGV